MGSVARPAAPAVPAVRGCGSGSRGHSRGASGRWPPHAEGSGPVRSLSCPSPLPRSAMLPWDSPALCFAAGRPAASSVPPRPPGWSRDWLLGPQLGAPWEPAPPFSAQGHCHTQKSTQTPRAQPSLGDRPVSPHPTPSPRYLEASPGRSLNILAWVSDRDSRKAPCQVTPCSRHRVPKPAGVSQMLDRSPARAVRWR